MGTWELSPFASGSAVCPKKSEIGLFGFGKRSEEKEPGFTVSDFLRADDDLTYQKAKVEANFLFSSFRANKQHRGNEKLARLICQAKKPRFLLSFKANKQLLLSVGLRMGTLVNEQGGIWSLCIFWRSAPGCYSVNHWGIVFNASDDSYFWIYFDVGFSIRLVLVLLILSPI